MDAHPRWAASLVCAALVTTFAAPRAAHAGPWTSTFEPPAIATHVDAAGRDVVVVSVGGGSSPAHAAARDLRTRLADEATRVRDGASLGALKDLDDDEIVARARPLSADRVVIVRAFDDGDTPEVVVTVYAADGRTVGGFSAHAGDVVDPPATGRAAKDDVASAIVSFEEVDEEAAATFERRRVVFDMDLLVASDGNVATVSRRFHPMTGEGRPLDGAEFYRYVGRDDLARKYRSRRIARTAVGVGAAATAVTGLGLMFGYGIGKSVSITNETCDGDLLSDAAMQCEDDKSARRRQALAVGLGAGSGLLVGGLVLSVVAARLSPHPVAGTEALGLARTFNDNLRKELGLPKREPGKVTATPSASSESVGLIVSGRF